jgi:hypothetical protein
MEEDQKNEASKTNKGLFNYARYTSLAFQMIIIIAGCVWGGVKLDAWLGLKPLFTLLLSLIGVFAAIYLSVKDLFNKPSK